MFETMPDVVVALVAGIGLGLMNFGGLLLTVRQLPRSAHPASLALASFFARMAVTLAGFYVAMAGDMERLMVCMAGYMITRTLLVRAWRPRPTLPLEARRVEAVAR